MPPTHTHTGTHKHRHARARSKFKLDCFTLFALARPLRCDVLCRLNEKELEINEIQLPLPFGTYAQQTANGSCGTHSTSVALACALSRSPSRAFRAHTCVCVCALRLCCAGFVFLFVCSCARVFVCVQIFTIRC